MVKYNRESLLSHNLCKQYLISKWMSYGMASTLLGLIIYFVFLISLTTFVMSIIDVPTLTYENRNTRPTEFLKYVNIEVLKYIIWVGVIYNYCKEIAQMMHQKLKYLKDPVNYIELLLYILTPFVLMESDRYKDGDTQLFLSFSAIALFVAWFISLLYLQKFNGIGLYVVMFLQILATLIKVMLIFSIIILAFSISFHVLLGDIKISAAEKGFFSVPLSTIRVLAMMLGELDFIGSFINPYIKSNAGNAFQFRLTIGFFVLFGILVPVLLVNLLIGLAVGDIETVRRSALLKTLAMQVEIHSDLEERLPEKLIKKVYKKEMILHPNIKKKQGIRCSLFFRIICSLMANSIFESGKEPLPEETETSLLREDLEKQRSKLKELSTTLNSQFDLVKLIVQKMEIVNEQDDFDEGDKDPDRDVVCHQLSEVK